MPPLPYGWEEFTTDDGEPYYFNAGTNQTVWDRPGGESSSNDKWEELSDDNGKIYFFNPVTDVTAWELPDGASLAEKKKSATPKAKAAEPKPVSEQAAQEKGAGAVKAFGGSMLALRAQGLFSAGGAGYAKPEVVTKKKPMNENSQFAKSLQQLNNVWEGLQAERTVGGRDVGRIDEDELEEWEKLKRQKELEDLRTGKKWKAAEAGGAGGDAVGARPPHADEEAKLQTYLEKTLTISEGEKTDETGALSDFLADSSEENAGLNDFITRVASESKADVSEGGEEEAAEEMEGFLQRVATFKAAQRLSVCEDKKEEEEEAPWKAITFPGIVFLCYENNGHTEERPLWGAVDNLELGLIVVAWEGIELLGPSEVKRSLLLPYDKIIFWTVVINDERQEFFLDLTMEGDYHEDHTITYWTGNVLDMRLCLPDKDTANSLSDNITEVCKLFAEVAVNRMNAAENFSKSTVANASLQYIKDRADKGSEQKQADKDGNITNASDRRTSIKDIKTGPSVSDGSKPEKSHNKLKAMLGFKHKSDKKK
ncbi:hypothetical protein CYMTET_13296 [Cymbomonas tetramitiformis]|uniref:WW domain-containing protein n=1 Tax=Cymbomonas tetramitiformis TaxID=36881 RepID=A0AAE0GIS2_9CHLO|nr:hypothetical protein CYMTET_13296 [Cymbomonas tetramitiformis]